MIKLKFYVFFELWAMISQENLYRLIYFHQYFLKIVLGFFDRIFLGMSIKLGISS